MIEVALVGRSMQKTKSRQRFVRREPEIPSGQAR